MTREVRANVIFLIVLCVLVAPGFAFLMYKKLTGTSRPNDLPDPVPTSIAYMQPLPAPPVPRREPRLVREWVGKIVLDRAGGGAAMKFDPRDTRSMPLVSDDFVTQYCDLTITDSRTARVALIRWADTDDLREMPPVVSINDGTETTQAPADRVEPIDVPREVRHALQDVGYVDPPKRVWWISAEMAYPRHDAVRTITLTRDAPGGPVEERITFPPPATRPSEARP